MTTTIIEKLEDGSFIRNFSKETIKGKVKVDFYTKEGKKNLKKMKKFFSNVEDTNSIVLADRTTAFSYNSTTLTKGDMI